MVKKLINSSDSELDIDSDLGSDSDCSDCPESSEILTSSD